MTDKSNFTSIQEKDLEYLRRKLFELYAHDSLPEGQSRYEYKRWDVGFVYGQTIELYASIGQIGDEGTLAECLARTSIQLFVGPKGGWSAYDSRKEKLVRGRGALLVTLR